MNNCTECKNFLDINSIIDNTTYRKWMLLNHPDKFRKFGETDPRYINATEHTKKASNCFSKWYGTGSEKICGIFEEMNISTPIQRKNSLLLKSVMIGDISTIKNLLSLGADVNTQNSLGETPLIIATKKSYPIIVNMLLKEGANPNIKDVYGITPLISAVYNPKDDINIVNELLEKGANVNYITPQGDTALILATRKKFNIDIINSLLDSGSNINIQNNDGMSALMYAARGNNINLINILLNAGADINLKNNKGQTALEIAIEKNLNIDIINIISVKSKRTDAGYKRKKTKNKKRKSVRKNNSRSKRKKSIRKKSKSKKRKSRKN